MSPSSAAAEIIARYESLSLGSRANAAVFTLVFFEHLITFEYEVEFLWRRKWSTATWIFVLNRYFLLANIWFLAIPVGPRCSYVCTIMLCSSPSSCNDSRLMDLLFFFTAGELSAIPMHVFTILRTFALLQDYSWRCLVTWMLSAIALVVITLGSYEDFVIDWAYVHGPLSGASCAQIGFTIPLDTMAHVTTAASAVSFVSAAFVLGIILLKTARQVHQASTLGLQISLSEVLLRDGSAFFLVTLVQNIMNIMITLNGYLFKGPANFVVPPLFNAMPYILLSRFIINLRKVDSPGTNASTDQHPSRFSMPNFRMPTMDDVVGNLGEPLDFNEPRLGDEDDGTNEATDRQGFNVVGSSMLTCVADSEAACPSGSGSADADILDINSVELEELRPVTFV